MSYKETKTEQGQSIITNYIKTKKPKNVCRCSEICMFPTVHTQSSEIKQNGAKMGKQRM